MNGVICRLYSRFRPRLLFQWLIHVIVPLPAVSTIIQSTSAVRVPSVGAQNHHRLIGGHLWM